MVLFSYFWNIVFVVPGILSPGDLFIALLFIIQLLCQVSNTQSNITHDSDFYE